MGSTGLFDGSHILLSNAIRRLSKEFAAHGYDLMIVVDQEVPHKDNFVFPDDWNTYYNDYFTSSRKGSFHYCVMAHRDGAGSWFTLGRGDVGGDMFVLYDANIRGYYPHDNAQASVFMHELGHNINVYDDDDTDGDGILDRYNLLTGDDDEDGNGNNVPNDGDNRNEDDDDDHGFEDYCEDLNCCMSDNWAWMVIGYCSHHWGQVDPSATFS